jgi:hypothetical protein
MSNRIVVTLNNFNEQRRTILHELREQLKQVTFVVEIHQNFELLQLKGKTSRRQL